LAAFLLVVAPEFEGTGFGVDKPKGRVPGDARDDEGGDVAENCAVLLEEPI
jgi:hypothetical protein